MPHIGLFVDSSLDVASICLPNLTVVATDDLEDTHPDGSLVFPFKHESWEEFIRHMDEGLRRNYYECHEELPKFGLLWLGKCVIPNF